MKLRRMFFKSSYGPYVVAMPVDPILLPDEVQVFPEPAISRTKTPVTDAAALEDLLSRCR